MTVDMSKMRQLAFSFSFFFFWGSAHIWMLFPCLFCFEHWVRKFGFWVNLRTHPRFTNKMLEFRISIFFYIFFKASVFDWNIVMPTSVALMIFLRGQKNSQRPFWTRCSTDCCRRTFLPTAIIYSKSLKSLELTWDTATFYFPLGSIKSFWIRLFFKLNIPKYVNITSTLSSFARGWVGFLWPVLCINTNPDGDGDERWW